MTPGMFETVNAVATSCADWYPEYVDPDDLRQELCVYAAENEKTLQRWADRDEMPRVHLALRGVAKQFGETAKAKALGYEFDDVAWYSPGGLVSLIPLALDGSWDGLTGTSDEQQEKRGSTAPGEGGTLLAMVMDVRRALGGSKMLPGDFDASTDRGMERLRWLSDRLGGDFPGAPGYRRQRRRAMSNDEAVRVTGEAA